MFDNLSEGDSGVVVKVVLSDPVQGNGYVIERDGDGFFHWKWVEPMGPMVRSTKPLKSLSESLVGAFADAEESGVFELPVNNGLREMLTKAIESARRIER